jgi:hypothetical protein
MRNRAALAGRFPAVSLFCLETVSSSRPAQSQARRAQLPSRLAVAWSRRMPGSVHRAGRVLEPLHRSRQPLRLHAEGGWSGGQEPAQVGRALAHLGIEHIAAYPLEARGAASGCSARCRIA